MRTHSLTRREISSISGDNQNYPETVHKIQAINVINKLPNTAKTGKQTKGKWSKNNLGKMPNEEE